MASYGWLLIGAGAVVVILYGFLIAFVCQKDRWPR